MSLEDNDMKRKVIAMLFDCAENYGVNDEVIPSIDTIVDIVLNGKISNY